MRQPGTPYNKERDAFRTSESLVELCCAKAGLGADQQSEKALRGSQARLARIVDSIITVDKKQSVLVFNRAAEKIFLCPAEDAIGPALNRF